MADKGKGLMLLMDEPEESEESAEGGTEKMAMKTLRQALKSGDDESAAKAMKSFMQSCYPQLADSEDVTKE